MPTNLVEVHGGERVLLAGDDDNGVSTHDGGSKERDKAEEGALVGACNADGADGLVDLQEKG